MRASSVVKMMVAAILFDVCLMILILNPRKEKHVGSTGTRSSSGASPRPEMPLHIQLRDFIFLGTEVALAPRTLYPCYLGTSLGLLPFLVSKKKKKKKKNMLIGHIWDIKREYYYLCH